MNDDITFIFNKSGYGKENWELQQRINKAIEYIENNSLYDIEYDEDIYENETYMSGANDEIASRDLLDILKGDDTNE